MCIILCFTAVLWLWEDSDSQICSQLSSRAQHFCTNILGAWRLTRSVVRPWSQLCVWSTIGSRCQNSSGPNQRNQGTRQNENNLKNACEKLPVVKNYIWTRYDTEGPKVNGRFKPLARTRSLVWSRKRTCYGYLLNPCFSSKICRKSPKLQQDNCDSAQLYLKMEKYQCTLVDLKTKFLFGFRHEDIKKVLYKVQST